MWNRISYPSKTQLVVQEILVQSLVKTMLKKTNTLFSFQSETSVLKSRLTIAESKNDSLEKEKGELEGAIKSMKSVKSESGKKSCYVLSSPYKI